MRILLLTQWFEPEPTFKGLQFARELRRLGHEVEVLTGFPNYPGGKVYPNYKLRLMQREVMDGIPILRVPLFPSHDRSGIRRAFNYLSFATAATVGALFVRRPDVVYAYHPPTTALPAIALKSLRGVPFVYDIQDLWPDSLAATGMVGHPRILELVGNFLQRIYHEAGHIVVQSRGFHKTLIERGVPERKLSVVPNWAYENPIPDTSEAAKSSENARSEDCFTVVFAGNMGMAQALETVLDAAALLQDGAPKLRFLFLGSGVETESLQRRCRSAGLRNVAFMPRRSPAEADEIMASADALLVHLKDDPLFSITIPSKTQAYLRAGKPILMGVRGDAARMIEAASAGVAFAPQDPAGLAQAVLGMMALDQDERRKMGDAGAAYYREHLALEVGVAKFARILERARFTHRRGFGLKRLIDFVSCSLLLAFLGVPMLVIAWRVARTMGQPVSFRQERPGRYGKPFRIFKFRTMTDARDADGKLLPDGLRLTPFGRWLRSTSLDELPELLNVLRGEMSVVGPRPLLPRYTRFFTEEESFRLVVRPGITGFAEVNGRKTVSWDDRIAMDAWYIRNWSLWMDIRTLALTAWRLVARHGIDVESVMQNLDDE